MHRRLWSGIAFGEVSAIGISVFLLFKNTVEVDCFEHIFVAIPSSGEGTNGLFADRSVPVW